MSDLDRSHPKEPARDSGADPVNLTAAPPPAAQPAKRDAPSAEALAVWEDEDGRCEACSRAMDRACAGVAIDQPSNSLRLVCPDCKYHQPDPLTIAVVGPRTAEALAEVRKTTAEDSAAWLIDGLRAYGVLLRLDDRRRNYWLPGVGTFMLSVQRPDRPWVGGPLGKLNPHPTIRVKPQGRTRGLPRLPRRDGAGIDMSSSHVSAPSGAV